MYGHGFRLNGQFTSSLARDTPGEAPSRSTSWRLNGSSFSPSAAGQESLHAHADALPFGQIARQPADGEVKKGDRGAPRCRTTAPPRRTTHSQEKARSLPVDPVVRFGFTGETGNEKKNNGPSDLKALQSGPRTVYSTLNDSHRTLSGQTIRSRPCWSISFTGDSA